MIITAKKLRKIKNKRGRTIFCRHGIDVFEELHPRGLKFNLRNFNKCIKEWDYNAEAIVWLFHKDAEKFYADTFSRLYKENNYKEDDESFLRYTRKAMSATLKKYPNPILKRYRVIFEKEE